MLAEVPTTLPWFPSALVDTLLRWQLKELMSGRHALAWDRTRNSTSSSGPVMTSRWHLKSTTAKACPFLMLVLALC